MNTAICMLYRDGNDDKTTLTEVVAGEISFADVKTYLDEGKYFIPKDVGLPHPGITFLEKGYEWPTEADHPWVEVDEDSFEPTRNNPTTKPTAQELIAAFKTASEKGWPGQNKES